MKPIKTLIFFSFLLITGCDSMNQSDDNILAWDVYSTLPEYNGKPSIGFAGPVTGVTDDYLIIAGGANFPDGLPWEGGKKKYYDTAYLLNLKSGKYTETALPYSIGYSANTSNRFGVVAVGGENMDGASEKAILINIFEDKLVLDSLPNLPFSLTNAAATSVGNLVYLAGGETAGGVSDQFYLLDLKDRENGWTRLTDLPYPVSHTVLLANEDSIYLLGGRAKQNDGVSELYEKVFNYNIATGEWQERRSLPYPLSAGTGSVINQNTLALFGGDTGETFHKTELIIKEINQESDPARKAGLEKEKTKIQMEHPGFSKQVLLYDINKDVWVEGGNINQTTAVTTTAVRNHNTIYVPSGEIRAGIRTPQILRAKIKGG